MIIESYENSVESKDKKWVSLEIKKLIKHLQKNKPDFHIIRTQSWNRVNKAGSALVYKDYLNIL